MTGWRDRVGPPERLAAAGVVLVGAALRVHRLGAESLWLDEASTWYRVTRQHDRLGLLLDLPLQVPHPPLYYLVVDAWVDLAGTSRAALRFPSAVFGTATVALVYLVGARLVDRRTGLAAAAVVAVSPFNVHYAQEARMYTLLSALTVASFYCYVRLVRDGGDRWTLVGSVLTGVALGYTHAYGLLVPLAQSVHLTAWVVLSRDGPLGTPDIQPPAVPFRRWVASQAVVALALVPWLTLLLRKATASGGVGIAWIPPPDPVRILRPFFGTSPRNQPFEFLPAWSHDVLLDAVPGVGYPVPVAVVAGIGAVALYRAASAGDWRPGAATSLLAAWVLTPLLVPFVASVVLFPVLVPRYAIGATSGLYLLVSRASAAAGAVGPRWGRAAVIGLLVASLAVPLPAYYAESQKPEWETAVDRVEEAAERGDAVVVTEPFLRKPYVYHASRTDLVVTRLGERGDLERLADGERTVWLVSLRVDSPRPAVESRLNDVGYVVGDRTAYEILRVTRFDPAGEGRRESASHTETP